MHNPLYIQAKILFLVLGLAAGLYNPKLLKYVVAINIVLPVAEGVQENILLNVLLVLVVIYICIQIYITSKYISHSPMI
jgi:hypothetical protein